MESKNRIIEIDEKEKFSLILVPEILTNLTDGELLNMGMVLLSAYLERNKEKIKDIRLSQHLLRTDLEQ